MGDYQVERQAGLNYIRNSLERLTNKQLDDYARMVQCCMGENGMFRKLGVGNPRGHSIGYIRNYMDRLTNEQLGMVVGAMMKRIEDNYFWKLYDRENWEEAW